MEADGMMMWEAWSAAFKAKIMPAHWEFPISRTLCHLFFCEASHEAWRTFDNAVILHCSHLLGMSHYPSNSQMADLHRAACLEGLFLHLVGEPDFHIDNLDCLCTLIENHVDCIQHEHVASQPSSHSTNKATSDNMPLPHPISYYHDPSHSLPYYPSPVGCYIREVFHKENQCYDCHKLGHQHSKCPTHTHALAPKVNQLKTELMAGNATSAYLTLAQTTPPADDDTHDMMYALFHPLLSISVPVSANIPLPAPPPP